MLGQGRPNQFLRRVNLVALFLFSTSLTIFVLVAGQVCAQILPPQQPLPSHFTPVETPVSPIANDSHGLCRVNISWGGGEARTWQGEMRLSGGQMRNMTLLGSEADVPGTIWVDGSTLGVRSRSGKTYSGVHVTLDCSPNAQLQVFLTDRDKKIEFTTIIPVSELLKNTVQHVIDESGNRIRIERVPADELSVRIPRGTTVFQPGESLQFEVLPRFLSVPKEKNLFLNVSLFRGRSNDRVREIELPVIGNEIPVGDTLVPIELTLPQEEGTYDVVLTLHRKSERGLFGGGKDKVFVQRTFQCLIMAPMAPPGQQADLNATVQADYRGTLVESVDPSNPNWWRRYVKSPIIPRIGSIGGNTPQQSAAPQYEQFPEPEEDRSTFDSVRERVSQLSPGQLLNRNSEPTFWRDDFGSGHVVPWQSIKYNAPGFVEMRSSHNENSPAWQAYAIPVTEPGKPHFLEIDYLSGIPQTLGISIVEPTVSGGLFPGTVDSGLHVSKEILSDNLSGRTLRHRILFWPKTKTPIILLTNHSTKNSAIYGGMRIYRAPDVFPQSNPLAFGPNMATARNRQRLFATYLHRPNFCESFSATRMPGHIPHVGVTDWETFQQGINRTVQHMRMVGYGGLMISVASDGSCLYPSRLISPTPRYDSGAFLPNGEDPVRKDVLHAMATAFDRENMTLIPAIDFCMPLPAIEEQMRRDEQAGFVKSPVESGLVWVGPYGNLLIDQFADTNRGGRAPYYNLLNPVVQNAMLDVVRELVERTASHPSFGGVAVQLSPEGYAMLPEEFWGLDDDTISRFSRDTRIIIPDKPGGENDRYLARAELIRSQYLEQWLRWRADQVSNFYRRMAEIVTQSRPDAKLYLAGAKIFDSTLSRRLFFPSLTQPGSATQALAYHGFDMAAYQGNANIVFMRPEKIIADDNLAGLAANLELSHTDDLPRIFRQSDGQTNTAASLFYHQPIERTLPEFDAKSPYQPAQSWFLTEAVPAGDQNRMRFVRHLADYDIAAFFDGGVVLPLGEEEAVREMVLQYQMLPRQPFQKFGNDDTDSKQPITLRYANTDQGTYCYIINDASFSLPVKVTFDARQGSRISPLSMLRNTAILRNVAGGFEWSETLRPYDFVAFVVSDTNAKPKNIDADIPTNIAGTNGQINRCIEQLNTRIRLSRNWLEWGKLQNGNFEMSLAQWQQFLGEQQQLAQAGPSQNGNSESPYTKPRSFAAIVQPQFANLFSGRNSVTTPSLSVSADATSLLNNTQSTGESGAIVPGWQIEGDASFRAIVEPRNCREGSHCLRLTAQNGPGGITSMPFDAPRTGRLFISLWVGVSQDAVQLPLKLVVKGEFEKRPFLRSAIIGPAIWDKISQTPPIDGVRWHQVVIHFKDLPLTGLDTLTIGLEVNAPGSVWVDDLRMYHLAFTDTELTQLTQMASFVANYRISKGRVSDAIDLLEGYWPQLLAECMPNIDELLAQQNANMATVVPTLQTEPKPVEEPPPKKKTFGDRIKDLKWW